MCAVLCSKLGSHTRPLLNRDVSSMVFVFCLVAGGTRFDEGSGSDGEVQRTMLEIVNQLDGFDARGNVKVLMATNRPDTLDPALLRPGACCCDKELLLINAVTRHGQLYIIIAPPTLLRSRFALQADWTVKLNFRSPN